MSYTVYVSDSNEIFDQEMLENEYDAILNEGDDIVIMGLTYYPATVLYCTDPTAYRVGFSDFTDEYTEHEIPDEIEWEDIPEYLGLV